MNKEQLIKLFIIFISATFLSCSSSTQDTSIVLDGYVLDDDGKPLSLVDLKLDGRKLKVDEKGYFCFDSIYPDTAIILSISSPQKKELSISLERGFYSLNVVLKDFPSKTESTFDYKKLGKKVSFGRYCVEQRLARKNNE